MAKNSKFFKKIKNKTFEKTLLKLEANEKNAEKFVYTNFWTSVFVTLITTATLLFFKLELFFSIILGTISGTFFFVFIFSIEFLKFEKNKKEKEINAVDFLFEASLATENKSFEAIIFDSGKDFGLLGMELKQTSKMIKKGATPKQALNEFKKRNQSEILNRIAELLIIFYENGSNMSEAFRKTAEDILKTREIIERKNASLLIQKYSLLFAGGIIVPIVLGMIGNIVQGFDFYSMDFFFNKESILQKKTLTQTIIIANQIYIIEYAIIAGFFAGLQENNYFKGIFYAMTLLPLGLIAYFVSSSF